MHCQILINLLNSLFKRDILVRKHNCLYFAFLLGIRCNYYCVAFFFFFQPSVLIVSYKELSKAASQFGPYKQAEWRPDSTMIAVSVSRVFVFLYIALKWL